MIYVFVFFIGVLSGVVLMSVMVSASNADRYNEEAFAKWESEQKSKDCDEDAWYEFRPDGQTPMSLHEFVEVDTIPNCEVQILKCQKCGKLSVGWKRMEEVD